MAQVIEIEAKPTWFSTPIALGFILMFILLGVIARFWNIGAEGLRLDESQSVWQASHSLEFIRMYMLKNVHLPLHNSLLHWWMGVFGTSEGAVRALALIPGLLSIPALYLLAREFLSRRFALFAAALGSLSPFWVWYSREIRMYSLLTLITILSYYYFIKAIKEDRAIWYIFYGASALVGIYTHYFFFLVLLSQLVFFFTTWKINWGGSEAAPEKKWHMLIRFLFVALVVIGAFAPWVYSLAQHYGSGSLAPVLTKPTTFNIVLAFYEFMFGFQPDSIMPSLVAGWPLVILGGFVFLTKRHPISAITLILILGMLIPIAVGFAASQYMPLFLSRYFIIVTPLLFIFLAWFVSELPGGRAQTLIGAGMLGLFAVLLLNQMTSPQVPTRENYREAAQYVAAQAGPRDIVVASPPYLIYPIQYYYRGEAALSTLPIWDKRKGGIPEATDAVIAADAQTLKEDHRRLYFIVSMDLYSATESKLYLDNHFTKLEKRQFSKNVWVHVYQTEYDTLEQSPATTTVITDILSEKELETM
ncbi:MAG: hypothetical protein A2408_03895 [Candidatus Yonathbacteria bacterium RIFOXYC1_FULL_52_10]|uniref:Glycosyltransferase RgtA/B/C/D-like domain-containing protein n=1 Tax=Candidatus Yonathbacteria bacterium RIFOXYD1_FULL_52_36 TaxID=1802730 RepID=A0A1G2SJC2_9BACT|nr:MAG: hypothetical protein A2408_03895 [Candidatus Yonathbacteria bacterium RIFOXYC1_FULL_52_10]OHA84739.1 MAG: hypothetical protein A2591_03410 [Candidatus Yonathbacteria bacterium RIFOXYD1_FULL_52_36]